MRPRLIPAASLVWLATGMVWLACAPVRSAPAELKLRAYLVWGTDDAKPPAGKNYKPVEPRLRKKLKDLPLKWANWFEVNRVNFSVPPGTTQKVAISEKCALEVRNFGKGELEVVLIGKGKEVVRRRQSLPKEDVLFLGGNAPNSTAWLVVVERLE